MLEDHTHIVLAEAFSERPELVYPGYYFINPNTGSLSIETGQAAWVCGGCLYIGAVGTLLKGVFAVRCDEIG